MPTVWGSDGIPKKADFERRQYDSVIDIIQPQYLLSAIEKQFGKIQLEQEYPRFVDIPLREKLAKQFVWIHNYVVNK
ncbi:hypothetical protein [Bacillus wiedmannii]|uniref:hypothetical protein n=1 Tax=Bacillus wiedmannii TaxID=1890302 RepID=UPI001D0F12E0|nr:hypothetical protein [Bacillus wiedmannii]MCC2327141.1 hypothetical protein [Bacillus wiedmannii]